MLENSPFHRLRLIAAESEALAQEFSLHSLPVKMLSGVRGDGYMPSGCSNILVACPPEDVDFCTPYLALGAETSGTRILHGGYAGFPLPRKPEHEVALSSSGLVSFVRTHLSLDAASACVMFALSDPEYLQRNHARWTRWFGAWKLWTTMRPRDHIGYTTVAKILDPVAKTFRVWALDLPPSESSESARLRTPFVVVQCGAPRADAVRMALANQGLHQVVSRVVDARDGAVSLAMYGKSTRLVDRDVLAWLEVGMEMVSRSTSDASARELQFRGTPSRVGRRTVLISWRSPLSPEGLSSRVVRIAYRDYL